MTLNKLIILFFLSSTSAQAGEVMKAGAVLSEDSYVFTLDEAQKLKQRIEELENKENELLIYKDLDINNKQQIELLNKSLEFKEMQISEYKKIQDFDTEYIDKLEKKIKYVRMSNYLSFGGGIALTITSLILADKVENTFIDNQVDPETQLDMSTTPTVTASFKF